MANVLHVGHGLGGIERCPLDPVILRGRIHREIPDAERGDVVEEVRALGRNDRESVPAHLHDDRGCGDVVPLDRNPLHGI